MRDILKQIYGFAILHSEKVANPADDGGPASIATFTPKDRALSPTEIRIMFKQLEHVATLPTIRLGMKLYLLTMVRKSELQEAVWDEVDFDNAVWTMDLSRFCAAPSARLGHFPFEGDWAFRVQFSVPTARIVEAVDVFIDSISSRRRVSHDCR